MSALRSEGSQDRRLATRRAPAPRRLEGLEKLDEVPLLGLREVGAVSMALVLQQVGALAQPQQLLRQDTRVVLVLENRLQRVRQFRDVEVEQQVERRAL